MLAQTNGIDMARTLHQGRFAQTRMIAMSASVLMAHTAKRSGPFDETIRKPFDLDDLFVAIDRCLCLQRIWIERTKLDGDVFGYAEPRVAFGEAP
jgi:CheY-like chemotaxis protein